MRVALAIAVFLALPFIVFRGRTLWRWLSIDALTYLLAAAAWRFHGGNGIDAYLLTVGFFAVKLALFSFCVARAPEHEVRWSATRAAVISGLIYALVIPAMLRTVIDGDESFYVLVTESIARDADVDLANQYRDLERSATGRTDLQPQLGDLTGPNGEQFSRLEPLLSCLILPGFLMGGVPGAAAVIALFGVLLVRSTVRLMEDEGVSDATIRAVFPFLALAPPILFYATRIWPEVPAAFCFVEAVRGVRQRRPQRWIPALSGLALLKLRFLMIVLPVGVHGVMRSPRRIRLIAAGLVAALIPLLLLVVGPSRLLKRVVELDPGVLSQSPRGLLGLTLDGMAGIAFQAPFFLLAVFALTRWTKTAAGFRTGFLYFALYLFYLVPRAEWHGGWSPPLRYLVVAMPILALGAAAVWDRVSSAVITLMALWTTGLVAHGVARPWRKFHIANGENSVGEMLSTLFASDFSRLFPSLIRPNTAALVAGAALIGLIVLWRFGARVPKPLTLPLVALGVAAALHAGRMPGARVEFEDAHVVHHGGELHPALYQVARFHYRGGWVVKPGDAMSFLLRSGHWRLDYQSSTGAVIELAGRVYPLPPTNGYESIPVVADQTGRAELRCLSGAANLDRMEMGSELRFSLSPRVVE